MSQLSEHETQQLIRYSTEKARELGVRICVAVTDSGANLTGFLRMDKAFLGSVDVAIRKARTSALFPLNSGTFGEVIRSEQLLGMELSNGMLTPFPGGVPMFRDEHQIGAIGISGATAEQDEMIATYAIEKLGLK